MYYMHLYGEIRKSTILLTIVLNKYLNHESAYMLSKKLYQFNIIALGQNGGHFGFLRFTSTLCQTSIGLLG